MEKPTVIVITGPTASGKSALAIETALRLNTEIISADSRQVFHGIPVSTAMPSKEELETVPHHLIDILPLDAYYSASMFEEDAIRIVTDVIKRTGTAIVCGGSMMYIDAFCKGIDELPTVPDNIRQKLTQEFALKGKEWLKDELRTIDPAYFDQVDKNNIKRIFHAVEIIRAAGKPYSELRTGNHKERNFNIRKLLLAPERPVLFDRINHRVDNMINKGLEEEAQSVFHLRHLNSLNTVGLKEMFAYFDEEMDRHTAIERIKKNTRVYAKKQMTWWQRDKDIIPIQPNSPVNLL